MKASKILIGFGRLSDTDLKEKALVIASAMVENTHFTDPTPSIETLNTAIKNYTDALSESASKEKEKISNKNNMRKHLEDILSNLAAYVSFIAHGDTNILSSSGFSLSITANKIQPLDAIESFLVQVGKKSGEVTLTLKKVKGAKNYLYLYAPAPVKNNLWMHATSSFNTITLKALIPGTEYSFQICVTGPRNQVVYTDIIIKAIL